MDRDVIQFENLHPHPSNGDIDPQCTPAVPRKCAGGTFKDFQTVAVRIARGSRIARGIIWIQGDSEPQA